jgi:hypothetical protein
MSEMPISIITKSGNVESVRQLQQAGASFLIVGGVAVAVHGCRDFTDVDDLDIMIDPQIENTGKVMSALTASHIDVQFDASTLANPAKLIHVKVLHYWLDLLTPEGGVDFAELRPPFTSPS